MKISLISHTGNQFSSPKRQSQEEKCVFFSFFLIQIFHLTLIAMSGHRLLQMLHEVLFSMLPMSDPEGNPTRLVTLDFTESTPLDFNFSFDTVRYLESISLLHSSSMFRDDSNAFPAHKMHFRKISFHRSGCRFVRISPLFNPTFCML